MQLISAAAVEVADGRQWVRIGRDRMPLYRLSSGASKLKSARTADIEEQSVLTIPYRGGMAALAVEELVNEEDLTVKPLPELLQSVNRMLGAVILGDGTAAPVLNLAPLLDWLEQRSVAPSGQSSSLFRKSILC